VIRLLGEKPKKNSLWCLIAF